MTIIAVNSNNDIFAVNGRLQLRTGIQRVLQNCEQAIKAQSMEMIYAQQRGVNTFDSVWNGSPNLLSFEASARRALNRVADVVEVQSFDSNVVNNTLFYTATIRTSFGVGTING